MIALELTEKGGRRAFDLLAALVDRAARLVTKDELLDQVWPKMLW